MASGQGFSSNRAPLFDGTNYSFWILQMQTYLNALSYDIWEAIENGYTTPPTPPIDTTKKKLCEYHSKAKNAIMYGMVDSELVKIMGCKSTKEMWDKLKSIHEGDDKIKEAKMQTFRSQFEGLKMNDEEDIIAYMLKVNEIINSIKGLGENIKYKVIVKKILRLIPFKLDAKVSSIE